MPTISRARPARTIPTSSSPISACPQGRPTRACRQRSRSADDPATGVLVLSQYLETRYALDLVGERAEGVGYLLKDRVGDVPAFTDAVRRVARGGSALDPAVVERMVGRPRDGGPIAELTAREREVLSLMAEGLSNQAIAERLVITVAGVERHVTRIFGKLDLHQTPEHHRRVLAVLQYLQTER